jgi:hypothetical protein
MVTDSPQKQTKFVCLELSQKYQAFFCPVPADFSFIMYEFILFRDYLGCRIGKLGHPDQGKVFFGSLCTKSPEISCTVMKSYIFQGFLGIP